MTIGGVTDEKRDLIGLCDLVRDNAPANKPLRVSIRRLAPRGEKSVTVTQFYAERDDELLERLNEEIRHHGESGEYEVRIREKDPTGFDQSATERREFAPRAANPVSIAGGVAEPPKDRFALLAERLLEKRFERMLAELEDDDGDEDDDDEEDVVDEEAAREANPGPAGTFAEFLKDETLRETVKVGLGRLLNGTGDWLEAKVEKAQAEAKKEAEKAKEAEKPSSPAPPTPTTTSAPVLQGATIVPLKAASS